MLVPANPNTALQQGDIIRDVPFVLFPKVFNVKAEGVQGQKRLDSQNLATFDQVKEFSQGKPLTAAAVPLLLTPAMVVTQGCDLDFKDQITLARIYPIGHLLQDAKDAIDHDEPVVLHEVIRSITEG
jgi:hypothetical protein